MLGQPTIKKRESRKAPAKDVMLVRVNRQPLNRARLVKPLFVLCAVFYLCFSALHGERGIYALLRDKRELASLQQELVATKTERERVELKVSHLRSGSLDLDLLDEQMRRMLGVMKKGEVVVLNK
jgi:cell division protein FtsB